MTKPTKVPPSGAAAAPLVLDDSSSSSEDSLLDYEPFGSQHETKPKPPTTFEATSTAAATTTSRSLRGPSTVNNDKNDRKESRSEKEKKANESVPTTTTRRRPPSSSPRETPTSLKRQKRSLWIDSDSSDDDDIMESYHHRRVCQYFDDDPTTRRLVFGTVCSVKESLYHIRYDNGHEEQVGRAALTPLLQLYETKQDLDERNDTQNQIETPSVVVETHLKKEDPIETRLETNDPFDQVKKEASTKTPLETKDSIETTGEEPTTFSTFRPIPTATTAADPSSRVTPSPDVNALQAAATAATPNLPTVWASSEAIASPLAVDARNSTPDEPTVKAEEERSTDKGGTPANARSHEVIEILDDSDEDKPQDSTVKCEPNKGRRRKRLGRRVEEKRKNALDDDDVVESEDDPPPPPRRRSRRLGKPLALDKASTLKSPSSSSNEQDVAPPRRRRRSSRRAKPSSDDEASDLEPPSSSSNEQDVVPPRRRRSRRLGKSSSPDDDEATDLEPPSDSSNDQDVVPLRRRRSSRRCASKSKAKRNEESEEAEEMSWADYDSVSDASDAPKKNQRAFATLEEAAWLGRDDDEFSVASSSSEEEELEAEEAFHRYELAETPSAARRASWDETCPAPPPALSAQEQQVIVDSIEQPQDQALQRLLLNANFRYTLMAHQFLAVRMVAGVPPQFPLHKGSRISLPLTNVTMKLALHGLDLEENKIDTKGVLIADEMGLGKTIEALAGAILRNELAAARGLKKRATVIVSPNDAVQVQWRDALINNGVSIDRIYMFRKAQTDGFDTDNFMLMTRHTVQAEVRELFQYLEMEKPPRTKSALFPWANEDNIRRLQNQYTCNKKPATKNTERRKGEFLEDCVTRLIHLCSLRMERSKGAEPIFETLIVDEAHLLKNRATYWCIGTALMGTHAKRRVPLTGTPYNNGPGDLASLMTMIDDAKRSAYRSWWVSATSSHASKYIVKAVTAWHENYLVRRRKDDILKDKLPPKIIRSDLVPQFKAELFIYEEYEQKLCAILKEFRQALMESDNPIVQMRLSELFTILMALMSNMRSANIHAMLPGGREYTKQFSPSRRHLLAEEERPKACVRCNRSLRPSISLSNDEKEKEGGARNRTRANVTTRIEMEEGEVNNNDDDDADDIVDEADEELVPLPSPFCQASDGNINHFVHEKCLDILTCECVSCPRCMDAKNRANFVLPDDCDTKYCQHINGGFTGSSKINAIVNWYKKSVPEGDKVLILSFFKGGLDLLEGIFTDEFGIDCARFDGDLNKRVSLAELERFKRDPDCRILLATVQSGGVGLNIVEANHVAFLDRWYNPFVHSQAEDRCYRIGQKKEVDIVYFDCAATIDEAMACLNDVKRENAAILLADGFEIGNQQAGGLSYKELGGLLGKLMTAIRAHRAHFLLESPDNVNLRIPRMEEKTMMELVNEATNKKPKKDSKETDNGSDDDSSDSELETKSKRKSDGLDDVDLDLTDGESDDASKDSSSD